eukprot:m.5686 g.5686  ORF g.5686 m.5686 type:complete len:128 (+) comp13799_c0_seq1:259-642(+)
MSLRDVPFLANNKVNACKKDHHYSREAISQAFNRPHGIPQGTAFQSTSPSCPIAALQTTVRPANSKKKKPDCQQKRALSRNPLSKEIIKNEVFLSFHFKTQTLAERKERTSDPKKLRLCCRLSRRSE